MSPSPDGVLLEPLSPKYTEALVYAATLHRHQPRKGTQTPYLSHLMAVSGLVLEDGGSEDEAIGGLLHDAAEDQGREVLPYLRHVFGAVVADIVEGCSDALPEAGAEKPPWPQRKASYIDHLLDPHVGQSTLRVSAADKLHNARATVTDLRISGAWPQSNACVHQNLWYYEALSNVFQTRLPGDSRTLQCLVAAVDELFMLTPEVSREGAGNRHPEACDCLGSRNDLAPGEIDPFGGPDYSDEMMSQEDADAFLAKLAEIDAEIAAEREADQG